MFIVTYTWDSDDEIQIWQKQQFELLYEAREFAASLQDDGVAIVRIIKNQGAIMWVVTWNDERLEMYEEHFEDVHEAHNFIEYLEDEGIHNARLFKETFIR